MNPHQLENKLKKSFTGIIYSQKEVLDAYSVDASSYLIKPKLVALPKTIKDVTNLVKFATKNKVSIIPRAAGTGLVGNSIGDGIIIDMKNFDQIKVFKNYVQVGPGVSKGKLDQQLNKSKKFLGPNPSIGAYCSLGGMIGTNASGSHSLKYGSIIDNLLEVTFVSGNGELITLPSNKKYSEKISSIAKKIDVNSFPKVTKNSCGYRLDAITQNTSQKVFAGSEGTLGVMISAKLKIYNVPQKRILILLGFESLLEAARICPRLISLKPSALELVDHNILKNISHKFPSNTSCLLFLEFDSDLKEKLSRFSKIVPKSKIIKKISRPTEIQKWWRFRGSALSFSIKNILKKHNMPHIIEDATLPVEKLYKLIQIISKINSMFKTKSIIYGHAGNGNLHIRLSSKNKDKQLVEKIARLFFSQIIKNGGTTNGEHGDGLARTEFIKMQYGNKTYREFQKLKKLFDPQGILNPDKIISNKCTIIENLKMS